MHNDKCLKITEEKMNFRNGVSQECLQSIIHAHDLQEPQENIKSDNKQGNFFKEKIADLKKMSSGNSFLCGNNIIGKIFLRFKL